MSKAASNKAAASQKAKHRATSRRLNLRALVVLVVVVVVAAPGLVGIKILRDQYGAKAFLAEGKKQRAEGNDRLAIAYIDRFLSVMPDDLDALELKSKILFETATATKDPNVASKALGVHSAMIAVKPSDPRWEQARRRMVQLNLMLRRYHPALELVSQLKGDDAEAHRLYARASAGLGFTEKNTAAVDKARLEYEAAEAKEPGDVDAARELAQIYREQDKPDLVKALQVLDEAVLNTGNDPKKHAAALLARAGHFGAVLATEKTAAKADELERKSAADVAQAVRDDPDGLFPRLAAAELAVRRGDFDSANRHLAAINPAHRGDLQVKNVEGKIHLAEGRPEDAIQSWRDGLKQIGGNDAEMTWQLAHVLLQVGRVSDAEPLVSQYRRLVGGEEDGAQYLYLKALAQLKSNRPSEAASKFEAIRYKVPKTVEPFLLFALGQSYEATRDNPKAMEAYRLAAERSKGWSDPWKALARLQAEENPQDAQATLQKGLALSPNNADLLTTRAKSLFEEELKKPPEKQSLAEVKRLLETASKVAPGSAEVALFRAEVDAGTGETANALELLKSASAMSPRTPTLWIAQANLLANLKRLGEAKKVLDQAIEVAGPVPIFYITRADVLLRQAHVIEAKQSLIDGLGRLPRDQRPLLWKSLGELYKSQKDYANAGEAFKQWAAIQPDSPEPLVGQFELALVMKDEAAVKRTMDEVRKVSGEDSYYWRLVKVQSLLRPPIDLDRDSKRLDEAQTLIKEIEDKQPHLALGYLLEGELKTIRKKNPEAIVAYRKALERRAGVIALEPLVKLLAAEKLDADLDEVRRQYPTLASEIEKLTTQLALRSGDKERAKILAEKALAGDPNGIDTQKWAIDVLQALGEPKEAEAAARKFIREHPTEPAPWLVLLMVQVKNRELGAAAETVELIRQKVKTERPEVLWAQCYRAVGNVKRADECYQEAVRRWPEDFGVVSAAVTFYEQTGNRDSAEEMLRLIRKHEPSNAWATQRLALSLSSHTADRPAWEEAISLVGPENRPNDGPVDQIIRSAVYAQSTDPANLQKAIDILEDLLKEQPERADLHAQASRLMLASGKLKEARPHAAKAAEGEAAAPDTILLYAGVLLSLNELPAAEEQLTRLTKIEPDGLPVAELKARILAARGKGDEAGELIEKAYEKWSSTADGLVVGEKMIQVLLSIRQTESAEKVARRVAEIAPRGRVVLAEVLAGRGKFDDAVEQLDKIAKEGDPSLAGTAALAIAALPSVDPRWLKLADRYRAEAEKSAAGKATFAGLSQLALQRHLEGKYKDEVDAYRKMLDVNPPNYLFLNNMAWTLSEELSNPEEGLKMVQKAIAKAGKEPHILDTRGVIYTRLGKYEAAVNDLEVAARELRDPSIDFHLARAYLKMGKPEEARKYRDRALRAGLVREKLQPCEKADWDQVMNHP